MGLYIEDHCVAMKKNRILTYQTINGGMYLGVLATTLLQRHHKFLDLHISFVRLMLTHVYIKLSTL